MPSYEIQEREVGGTKWIGFRARGSDWSWILEDEAAAIGRLLIEKYGQPGRRN